MIIYLYFHASQFYRSDGTSTGDGSHIGNCPSHFSTYKCLSTGSCNVCGLISGKAEGCNVFSTASVCDADSTTSGYQSTYLDTKEGACTQCKNKGIYKQKPKFAE